MLITFLVILAVVAVLAIWLIPWIRKQKWAAEYFWWLEPVAITTFQKSEAVLYERVKQLIGAVATLFGVVLPMIGAIDPTVFMPFLSWVPEEYRTVLVAVPALALWLDGLVGVKLRKQSTLPLPVVALPMNKQDLPEVVELKEAKDQAVVAAKVAS